MKNKNLWLATTAVALLGTASQANADGLYVSVFGGANLQPDLSGRLSTGTPSFLDYNLDPDTGFVIGGVIGTGLDRWVTGLRAELEVSFRRNDIVGDMFSTQGSTHTHTGSIDANQSTFALMTNVWYDINVGSKFKPYVGGGIGWARSHWEMVIRDEDTGTYLSTDTENSGFAWQLGLGFNYEVDPGVDVGLGYRYFVGPRNSSDFRGNHQTYDTALDNENHSVMLSLTIDTN